MPTDFAEGPSEGPLRGRTPFAEGIPSEGASILDKSVSIFISKRDLDEIGRESCFEAELLRC